MSDTNRDDAALAALIDRLHRASGAQVAEISDHLGPGDDRRPTGFEADDEVGKTFFADKLVAIDRDKGEFIHLLVRAMAAARVVEAGTSHGLSTLYLASAIRAAEADRPRPGATDRVDSYEWEPAKVEVARNHIASVGLEPYVTIHQGEIREQLATQEGPVDLLLLDIWAPIAGSVLRLVDPLLRPGGVVVADNIVGRGALYGDLLEALGRPGERFDQQTLPFDGGLLVAQKR